MVSRACVAASSAVTFVAVVVEVLRMLPIAGRQQVERWSAGAADRFAMRKGEGTTTL